MKELFVPYELALKLNEKGFDNVECFAYFQGDFIKYTICKSVYQLNDTSDTKPFYDGGYSGMIPYRILAPLYQQALSWLMKKLDFNYPYISLEVFNDGSGKWYHPAEDGNDKLEVDFDNINQAIEQALTLI